MFTVIFEQKSTSLFSGWDWVDYTSAAEAMEKFSSCIAKAKLNGWVHIRVENEQGNTIAEWYLGKEQK